MKSRTRKIMSCLMLFAMALQGRAFADDGQMTDMMSKFQAQMKKMQDTINQQNHKLDDQSRQIQDLQNRGPQEMAPQAAPTGPAPVMTDADFKDKLNTVLGTSAQKVKTTDWMNGLIFSGDLRLRYEGVAYSQGNAANPGYENRFRFRLRYGFEKIFSPEMKVGFRLASGQTTDPTSTNQTLTGNFVDKNNEIDKAYAIYTPNWAKKGPVKSLELGAGKFTNPFVRGTTDMIWDTDVNPEGAYEMVDLKLIDGETVGLNSWITAGQLILKEAAHATGSANSEIYAFQAGLNPQLKLLDMPLNFTNAFSFYDYSDYAHNSTFIAGGNPNVDGEASTLDANEFRVVEVYNAVEFKPFSVLPVFKPYFDWAMNTADNAPAASAGGEDQAWALGMKIGNPKKKGDWDVGYAYKYIEANSVVGAFNDSDFGHTDRRGSMFYVDYKLTDALTMSATGFYLNNMNHDLLTRDQAEKRFFVDLVWGF